MPAMRGHTSGATHRNDTPDTECRHLFADEKQMSTPSRTTSTSSPPSADTASTTSVMPRARHRRPTSPTGFSSPTDVSWWIIATAAMSGVAVQRARDVARRSAARPSGSGA